MFTSLLKSFSLWLLFSSVLLLSACETEQKSTPHSERKTELEMKKPIYDRNDRRAENRYDGNVNVNNN